MAVSTPPATTAATPAATREPWPSPAHSWYAVSLFAIMVFTLFAAFPITGLVVEMIKVDFHLTDKEVALLVSSAAMWVNAFASLFISRLADSFSRKLIIGIGLLVLGLCGSASAVASTATIFFVIRLIGGIGGAGNGSATYSMLGDLFPLAKLPKAVAVMNFGFCAALGLPLILGAKMYQVLATLSISLPLIGELRPWQSILLFLAVPDAILGLLILFTLREPKRRARSLTASAPTIPGAVQRSVPVKDIVGYLWGNRRAFWPMYVGLGLNCVALGTSFWIVPFYQRTFGWTPDKFGYIQGLVYLLLAPLSLLFGGWLAEYWSRQGRADAAMRVVFYASLLHIPFAVSFGLVPNPYVALALLSASSCIILMGAGPQNGAFQSIVPNEMRAQVTASFLFVFTVMQAAGPFIVGWLTDNVFGDPKSLRYALALIHGVTAPLAVLVFWIGLKPYGEAVIRARAWQN
jgi:MFS family permease